MEPLRELGLPSRRYVPACRSRYINIGCEQKQQREESFTQSLDATRLVAGCNRVSGFGLAEERGKREAVGSAKNLSNGRLREGFVEKVKTRPGDAALRDTTVDMIKLDINGSEREALKGLRKTLKRKRPVVAIDFSRPRSLKAQPLLARLGYTLREETQWRDAEGDRRFAIFTSSPVPVALEQSVDEN